MNQIKGKRTGRGLWLLGGILLAVVGLALLFASRQPEKPQPPPPAAPSEQTAAEKPMSQKKKAESHQTQCRLSGLSPGLCGAL